MVRLRGSPVAVGVNGFVKAGRDTSLGFGSQRRDTIIVGSGYRAA